MVAQQTQFSHFRLAVFILVDLLIFAVLTGRVYTLQIQRFSDLSSEAVRNMYREYEVQAPRGIVYDRYHRPIVYNTINYDLAIYPYEIIDREDRWHRLSQITEVPVSTLQDRFRSNMISHYQPVRVMSSIDFSTLSRIQEHLIDIPGLVLYSKPVRHVNGEAQAAHLLGYTNEINREMISQLEDLGYRSGDIIGIKGIEKEYEDLLRGQKGKK